MRKCEFSKIANNFIEITVLHGCSHVNFLDICAAAVLTNTHGGLLLQVSSQHVCHVFQYKFVSFFPYF